MFLSVEQLEHRCVPATLHMGLTGETYSTLSQVAAQAHDGDTILIDAGTYNGQFATFTQNNLTIEGAGGSVIFDDTGVAISDRKGILDITGNNVTVENIELDNAHDQAGLDKNWAGIRGEGNTLTVFNCKFFHDDDGILINNDNNASTDNNAVTVRDSEFGFNGYGDGYSHNMYIGLVTTFTLEGCYTHDANQGHLIKSRALTNFIEYNDIEDGTTGGESSAIDLPYGGQDYVIGNVIVRSATAANHNIITYDEETGSAQYAQRLYVVNNTFVNNVGVGTFVAVSNTPTSVSVIDNIFAGGGTLLSSPVGTPTNNLISNSPGFVNAAAGDYHLAAGSAAIGAAVNPGTSSTGFSLTPVEQYLAPLNFTARANDNDLGAFQFGSVPATPSGLVATPGQNQISLAWNPVSGATSYNLYRSTTPGGEGATPFKTGLSSPSFTDPGLVPGTNYYYQVTAVGATDQSSPSSEATATVAGNFSDPLNVNNTNGLDANWNVFFGQFSITGGHALGTAEVYPHGNLAEALLPAPLTNPANVSLSIDFNLAATPTTANGRYVGLLARIQDPSDFYAAFVYYNSVTHTNLIGVGYQLPGPFNSFVSPVQIPIAATSGTLRFDLFGNTLKVYLNGVLEISTTDNHFTTAGGVGFGDAYSGGGQFNNFAMTTLQTPPVPFNDTFHRSSSSSLGDPWSGALGGGGFGINVSNQATSLGSGTNSAFLNGVNLTTSTSVSATVVNAGGGAGVVADWNGVTNSGYALVLSGSMLQLYKVTNGSLSALGPAHAAGAATGNVQLVAASGVLSVYFNSSLLFTINDSTFTSGSAGLIASGVGVTFSSFSLSGS